MKCSMGRVSNKHRMRLYQLASIHDSLKEDVTLTLGHWTQGSDESLLRAGYLSIYEQREVKRIRNFLLVGMTVVSVFIGFFFASLVSAFLAGIIGLYLGFIAYAIWRKSRASAIQREVYFQGPLVAEELILLVESGLALSAAIQEVSFSTAGKSKSIVHRVLSQVYVLAASGIPMAQAYESVAKECPFPVLRHFLLHLETSSTIGGELVGSLQALAEQIHSEWKLEVETRVKRLENLVVFPVFTAVMGLMLLTAAVPLVPVVDFMDTLKKLKPLHDISEFKESGVEHG